MGTVNLAKTIIPLESPFWPTGSQHAGKGGAAVGAHPCRLST